MLSNREEVLNKTLQLVLQMKVSPNPNLSLEDFKKQQIMWLLKEGAALETYNSRSLLNIAAEENEWEYVLLFLETLDKSLKTKTSHIEDILWYAVRASHYEMVKLILSRRSNINKIYEFYDYNYDGRREYSYLDERTTLLHEAVQNNDQEMVELLLAKNHITDIKNLQNETPIEVAAKLQYWDIVGALLNANNQYDVEILNSVLRRVLTSASKTPSSLILVYIDALLKAGASPNAAYRDTAPLHMAVNLGHQDILFSLLKSGADITVKIARKTAYESIDGKTAEEIANKQQAYNKAIDQIKALHTARVDYIMFSQVKRQNKLSLPSELWDEISTHICGGAISPLLAEIFYQKLHHSAEIETKQKLEMIAAFRKIYAGLNASQYTNPVNKLFQKANFMMDKKNMPDRELFEAIMLHIEEKPNSRTAKAWALTTEYHGNYSDINLFKHIHTFGQSLFSRTRIKSNSTSEDIIKFAEENSNSRTAKIMGELKPFSM